ncbi:MAG TPA: hypothetical protein VET66_06195 [Steroidobacteraceae bacterium]|nr:hypothetical protein [Steroidobacteraceae bacterium]
MNKRIVPPFAAALLVAAGAALAAAPAEPQLNRYVDSDQGKDPAVREAGAARAEAKRGMLGKDDHPAEFERNRLARCDKHTGEDRDLCIRRMNGEGTITGSVEGGGILRELHVTVPAAQQ